MDLDSFLLSSYVLVDDWWRADRGPTPRGPGRPAPLADSEVLTLAILAQEWPRFRSERDLLGIRMGAPAPLLPEALRSQGQFDRRVRALEPELRALQRTLAEDIAEPSAVYRVLGTTLIPAVVRVRASRGGLCSPGRPPSGGARRRPSGRSTGSRRRWWWTPGGAW